MRSAAADTGSRWAPEITAASRGRFQSAARAPAAARACPWRGGADGDDRAGGRGGRAAHVHALPRGGGGGVRARAHARAVPQYLPAPQSLGPAPPLARVPRPLVGLLPAPPLGADARRLRSHRALKTLPSCGRAAAAASRPPLARRVPHALSAQQAGERCVRIAARCGHAARVACRSVAAGTLGHEQRLPRPTRSGSGFRSSRPVCVSLCASGQPATEHRRVFRSPHALLLP